ncbi:hypothetical protein BCR42DRAFT_408825 [Absidia repens]|uniref:DH domain-containing protein n=1 Tax=Absidia repens TaxID=90262 RepID=A0A1X2IQA5_9FUNG|nr:hypothetical protein BCR42DRAFT_408825 [Absidia repens]
MPEIMTIDILLKDLGYDFNSIPATNESHLVDDEDDKLLLAQTKLPLAQRIDVVFPKSTLDDQNTSCQQLIDVLGTRYIANDHSTLNSDDNKVPLQHKYEQNDQLRLERFDELLKTEENYIRKLQPLVNTIVKPLKVSCAKDKHPVLKQYMCTNIFLNLEQILDLHQQFLKDLKTHPKDDFATLCSIYMGKMDRYRRYLLKVNDAHELHTTEYQKNQMYRSFIIKATTNPVFQKLRFENLLDEPWKRITAYVVLLEEIRNYTPKDHPDFAKLTDAFTKINTVASVRDDLPTMLATKSHDLYLSIRKAPCHLIKQSRSLVTHMDAVEINGITGKVSRHVTIFLFCDKIMVASRSSHAKGSDICGETTSGSSPLTNLVPKKKKDLDFKFCGWIGLQHIDLIQGPSDLPGSIMVRTFPDFQDSITETATGYEKYFKKGTRTFAYQAEPSCTIPVDFMKKRDSFVDAFYKAQAIQRQYGNQDATYHRVWKSHQVYSNVYDQETYAKTEIKNNVATIFLEKDSEVDIPSFLNSNQSSPWIVALVRPGSQGLKLNIWSKVSLSCNNGQQSYQQQSDQTVSTERSNGKTLDFADVFWSNVVKYERKLQCSCTYRLMNEGLDEQEMRPRHRSHSRSRTSMYRSSSISSISRFFGRSRSQSPFSSSASSSSTPHLTLSPSKSTPLKNKEQDDSTTRNRRPRAHSLSNDSNCLNTKTKSTTTTRRRKLSFDTSFFKFDIKPTINTSVSSSSTTTQHQQQPKSFTQKCQIPSPQTHIQQLQNSIRRASLSHNSKQHQATTSPTAARPIPVPSISYSPGPPSLHPTELPSPNVYPSNRQMYRSTDYSSSSPSPSPSPPPLMVNKYAKQRQLGEKLDAIYHDMTGIDRLILADQQQSRHISDPLIGRPPSRTNSCTPVSTPSSYQQHRESFGTTSSRSSSYTNTFSSYASQSSRSSVSLEELDAVKGYGPPPQLANMDIVPSSNNHQKDDDIVRKVMTDLANSQKRWSCKSLSSHYASAVEETNHAPRCSPGPVNSLRTTAMEEGQPVLDHVASAVDHCSYEVGLKWHFLLDKHRMLGSQVNRVADHSPSSMDTGMLSEMYQDTMNETTCFFNKINTELEEISSTVNAYRQGSKQQYQPYRTSSIDQPTYTTREADNLLTRKLKEAQIERDYWHRRTSELTNQLNEFMLRQ